MGILSAIQKIALAPSVVAGNAISNIIKPGSGTTTTSQLQSTTFGKVLGTSIAATGAALAVATGAAGSAAKGVISSAAAHPIQTVVGGVIGVPLIVGAIAGSGQSPEVTVGKLSGGAYKAGETLVNTAQEHPIVTAIIGSVTGGVAAYEVGKEFFGGEDSKITQLPTIPATGMPVQTLEDSQKPQGQELPEGVQAQGSKASKKRRKTRSEPRRQTISQRVDVRVGVNAANKKYIKMAQYV